MIDAVDSMLAGVISSVPEFAQIGFEPPDEDWKDRVAGEAPAVGAPAGIWVNVYLAEIRERTTLRNEDTLLRTIGPGQVETRPAPTWVDCHYLITAWSTDSDVSARAVPEHRFLAGLVTRLRERSPLCALVLLSGAALAAIDPLLRPLDLPTDIAPPEGFPRLGDFWNSIGDHHRWKPSVHVVVAVPLLPSRPKVDGIVESILLEAGTALEGGAGIEAVQETLAVGGVVLTTANGSPVAGITVVLEGPAPAPRRHIRTDSAGRFVFDSVPRGAASLEWGAPGAPRRSRTVQIPSQAQGDYVLPLT